MKHVLAQIDGLFYRLTGCRSRTAVKSGKTLSVRFGGKTYGLMLRTSASASERYYFKTRRFSVVLAGNARLSGRTDLLLKQYCGILAAHDGLLFRGVSDQPLLIEHVYARKGGAPRKECRLFVTLRCNQRCLFCQNLDFEDRRTFPEVKKLLDDYCRKNAKSLSVTDLAITGGEPTIAPYLVPLVRYAKKKRFHDITLQTNAVMLSDRPLVERLYNAGVRSLFISFHSPRERTYDRLTRTSGQYAHALQGVRGVLSFPFERVVFNMVLTRVNYADIVPLVKLLRSLPVRTGTEVRFFPSVLNENASWDGLHVRYSRIVPHLVKAFRAAPELFRGFSGDCAFPVCIGGLVKKLPVLRPEQRIRSSTAYVPAHGGTGDVGEHARVKRIECKQCVLDHFCGGLPRPYARQYGVAELSPLR